MSVDDKGQAINRFGVVKEANQPTSPLHFVLHHIFAMEYSYKIQSTSYSEYLENDSRKSFFHSDIACIAISLATLSYQPTVWRSTTPT